MMAKRRDLAGLVALALTACAGPAAREDERATTDTAIAARASTAPRGGDVESGATLRGPVRVARSGGIAGFDDVIVIHPDGRLERVTNARAVAASIDPIALTRLAAALDSLPNALKTTPAPGADRLTYMVEWGERRVEFDELTDAPGLLAVRDVVARLFSGGR